MLHVSLDRIDALKISKKKNDILQKKSHTIQ
jgi:hypothetical protein